MAAAYHYMMAEQANCQNCQMQLDGDYCGRCGQRNVDLERPIWALVGEVVKETFEVDGRAWLTIKTLFRHPGMLTSEYLAGRRKTYTSPLRLYLVTSILFFVLVAWLAKAGLLLDPGQDPHFDAVVQSGFLSDDLPRLMFILLPLFALIMKVAYWNRLYFDHLMFAIHLHTAGYVILGLMMPFEEIASESIPLAILQSIIFVYFVAYFVIAVKRVYESGWVGASLKSFAIMFAYMMVVAIAIESSGSFIILAD